MGTTHQLSTAKRAKKSCGQSMVQARHNTFLDALRVHGCVSAAAASAGYDRSAVYRYRDDHPEFAEQWADALETAADNLEMEARRRAVDGWDEAVFFQGQQCGTVRRYSDQLLTVLLRGAREKFRTSRSEVAGTIDVHHSNIEEVQARLAVLLPKVQHLLPTLEGETVGHAE